jgi:hypothetical protein
MSDDHTNKSTLRLRTPSTRVPEFKRTPTAFVRGAAVRQKPREDSGRWHGNAPLREVGAVAWAVWCESAERPRRKHSRLDRATREAQRLAAKVPGCTFHVIEVKVVSSHGSKP